MVVVLVLLVSGTAIQAGTITYTITDLGFSEQYGARPHVEQAVAVAGDAELADERERVGGAAGGIQRSAECTEIEVYGKKPSTP
jgi:hypothetical protein